VELHLRARRPSLKQRVIIIVDIRKKDYCLEVIASVLSGLLEVEGCPACATVGRLSKHAWYTKYYYREQIRILRVRCEACGRTHAVMPSFSLPGTSGGTWEAEKYLLRRSAGMGRGRAAGGQWSALGVSPRYGLQLERMFERSVVRAKALFAEAADPRLQGMEWVRAMVGDTSRPLYALNRLCLRSGVNPVCFCRASILRFPLRISGRRISHNPRTSRGAGGSLHCPYHRG
jgi:hypothetical protein